MTLRIMIVDDHELFREALHSLLAAAREFEVVADAANGHEAIAKAGGSHPDVVLMDINMRGQNGFETTRNLLAAHPGIKVIGLSAHASREYALEMLDSGGIGYVTKGEASGALLQAIRAAASGQTYFSPDIATTICDDVPTSEVPYSSIPLDSREQQILRLMAQDYSLHEIARQLFMDEFLIDAYQRNITRKAGLHGEMELGAYAKRLSAAQ